MAQRDRVRLEAFEMKCWRRMERISWTQRKITKEVLGIVLERRGLVKAIEECVWTSHMVGQFSYKRIIREYRREERQAKTQTNLFGSKKGIFDVELYHELIVRALSNDDWQVLH